MSADHIDNLPTPFIAETKPRITMEEFQERMKKRALQYVKDPELDEFARQFKDEAKAPNTIKAYRKDVELFQAWCEKRRFNSLPATANVIANYITHLALKKNPSIKVSTIERTLSAIAYLHKWAGFKTIPTRDAIIGEVLSGIKRKKGTHPSKKERI